MDPERTRLLQLLLLAEANGDIGYAMDICGKLMMIYRDQRASWEAATSAPDGYCDGGHDYHAKMGLLHVLRHYLNGQK